jgi:7 transmembrane receptor (rhodopsin family)
LVTGKRKVDHFSMNNDIRASITCGIIVGLFFLAWTPYAVVALIGVFGDQSRLTPMVNALPSLFAKSSAVFNPIVYAFMNNKFRQAILSLIGRQRHRTQRRQSPLTIYVPRQSPEQICLPQPRQSDLSLADLQSFSKSLRNSRRSTEGSIQTISPANLSSPLIPPIAEENSSNLAHFSISPQTIEASPFPGYFFEEVGPGLKYGKFHSPTSPDAYGEMKLFET